MERPATTDTHPKGPSDNVQRNTDGNVSGGKRWELRSATRARSMTIAWPPIQQRATSIKKIRISVTGKNVGDLLNAKGLTWGWFQGGFAPTGTSTSSATYQAGLPVCGANHKALPGTMRLPPAATIFPTTSRSSIFHSRITSTTHARATPA